jgi:S-adenosylmethionine:tRNA ribosyltransferase-isomerase
METAVFDYPLPPELIAQEPAEPRDAAKLLVADLGGGAPLHRTVRDLADFLRPGDLMVLNRTRVIPARLFGTKASGGAVEVLLIHPCDEQVDGIERWTCFVRGKVRPGTRIVIADVTAEVESCDDVSGERVLRFPPGVLALAERCGHIPLPPYIRRDDRADDRERYQTVFADRPGSVAAPTASLHLTRELLDRLTAKGVAFAQVELRIGPGTFKPVDTERIEDFRIHAEHAICPPETVAAIAACKARGGRVVAVGTTVVRTLESAAAQPGADAAPGGLLPFDGWTRIFLHPPQRLRVVDGLMTNFHLPKSSLLMLVACLTGVERLHALYAEAIAKRYRFFSYGDATLLLPGLSVSQHPDA